MSAEAASRPLRLPPPGFNDLRIPKTRLPVRAWFQVHLIRRDAAYFSLNPGHRFSHPECPYPVLYLALDVATCLFERFGDLAYNQKKALPDSLWRAHTVSRIQVPELSACDLTSARTLSALSVDLSALMHHDLTVPQAWGLAIQRHPARFHGLKFKSRFNGKGCLALFNRDDLAARLKAAGQGSLSETDAATDWLEKHRVSLY